MANGVARPDGAIATYRVLRELGERSQPSYAAMRGDGSIVVLHRFARQANGDGFVVSAEQMALILRDARCLAKNWHPNVARVRHVDLASDVLHVATDLIDGITLQDLLTRARARRAHPDEPILSHAILARVFIDVLAGLQAIHALRDGMGAPLLSFHGELCPANVVVGKDGVARIVSVFRPHPVRVGAKSEALGYASPETLAGEVGQDARVDVYSVGVMLWEALMERRLYEDVSPSRIAQRQREEDVARPCARLADVAVRAIAFDPALRFRTAQEMAADIRALAGTVAQGSVVAQTVVELAGDRIRARRAELDPHSSARARSSMPPPMRTESPAHASAASPPPPSGSLATMPAREMRVSRPSVPDSETDDLPGPRQSTPDADYLEELAATARARAVDVDAEDILHEDRVALEAAREIVLSRRSTRPDPHPLAVPVPPVPRHEPSTKTPFVVDVPPGARAPGDATPERPRRTLPVVAAIATSALLILAAGAALITRGSRTPDVAAAAAVETPAPPSTVVVAPPAAELLPPPRATASTTAQGIDPLEREKAAYDPSGR